MDKHCEIHFVFIFRMTHQHVFFLERAPEPLGLQDGVLVRRRRRLVGRGQRHRRTGDHRSSGEQSLREAARRHHTAEGRMHGDGLRGLANDVTAYVIDGQRHVCHPRGE